jgi:hypothetical protein
MDELPHVSPDTRAALVTLAEGTCRFPGCRVPVLVFLGDDLEVNVEIVRIRGADPRGPRYVAGTTAAQRDSFGNLLLLCVPHRKIVDRDEKAYPLDLIETWRTGPPGDDLGPVTEERLDGLLTTAFATAREQVGDALLRLARTDADAARLLAGVVRGLHRERSRYGADPRLATALNRVLDALPAPAPKAGPARRDRINVGWRPRN